MTTDGGGALTGETALDAITAAMRQLNDRPPVVARFYASHSVPYGRVYRMWTTRGDLIAYINRGEIADMPRAAKPYDGRSIPGGVFGGIPTYFDA